MKSRSLFSTHKPQLEGGALIATLLVVAAIVSFLSIAALITSQFGRYAGRAQGDSDLQAAADAGLEYAYAQWKATAGPTFNQGLSAPVSSNFTGMDTALAATMNGSSMPFAAKGITFGSVTIRLANLNSVPDTTSTKAYGTPTSNVPNYPGWSGSTTSYIATVQVYPTTASRHFGYFADSAPRMTVSRIFQVTAVPLFQAAIFYENKLEIHPGAAMNVTGLVHTNDSLWARGFDVLQFKNNVSYVGTYNEIGDSSVTKGWDGYNYGLIPGVTSGYTGVPYPTWSDGLTSTNSASRATQLSQVSPIDPFGGATTADNSLHDMIEVPTGTSTNSNQIAYKYANLIITINSSLPTSNSSRVVITDGSGAALSSADATAVKAAINSGTSTTMYDQREATNMTITTLDMTKLAAATVTPKGKTATPLQAVFSSGSADPNTSGQTLAAGTVYIHDVSTATSSEAAIRLVNGSNLGENVTVASPNPVYVLGDYNTGGTGTAVPSNASNNDGTATPQVSGYTRYASAVLADAVTILSNSWTDGNASASLSNRNATPTTVNTAILSGDVPSNYNNNGNASGGAHNFPRFLENWNNVNFTYWGSLVEAFRSETATGLWQTGNVYYWPNRRWNFDTNFLTTQPPGQTNGIQYSRGRWVRSNS